MHRKGVSVIVGCTLAVVGFTAQVSYAVSFSGVFSGEIAPQTVPDGFDASAGGALGFIDRVAGTGVMGTFSYHDEVSGGAPVDIAGADSWGWYQLASGDPWLQFSIWTVSADGAGPAYEFGYVYTENVQEVSVLDQHFDPSTDVFSIWGQTTDVDQESGVILGDRKNAFFLEVGAPGSGSGSDMVIGDALRQAFVWNDGLEGAEGTGWILYDNQKFRFDLTSVTLTAATAEPAPAPVPEPTTMVLLGSGLVALSGISRRRKSP